MAETQWRVNLVGEKIDDVITAEHVISFSGELEFYNGEKEGREIVALYSRETWISAIRDVG